MAYKIIGVGKRSKSAAMSLTAPTAQEANAKAQGLRSNGSGRDRHRPGRKDHDIGRTK